MAALSRAGTAALTILLLEFYPPPHLARGGHEVSYYPAFYPSEITLTTLDPASAANALAGNRLHLYLGAAPRFSGSVPAHVRSASSLGGYVLLVFDPRAPGLAAPVARCSAAKDALNALAGASDGEFVFHPYPVTPFHEDYLAHADRAGSARQEAQGGGPTDRGRAIRASGALALRLAKSGWTIQPESAGADAALIELPAEQVLATIRFAGWIGPPWIKEGWYEAWRLLSPGLDDKAMALASPLAERLMRGDVSGQVESYNLERRLVDLLMQPCTRVVAGYTLRREAFNDDFSFGVENIASDSAQGLNNPVFIRTAKLKDFPWNGPLFVATAVAPKAAWNPVAGFGDVSGRLVWSIVADDAYMAVPDSSSWVPNRMDPLTTVVEQGGTAGVQVPPDALVPERGTGIFRPVGPGRVCAARVIYDVLASPFMDGGDTEPEDLLYPYALAFRWSEGPEPQGDSAVAAATELVRERLMGVRLAGTRRYVAQMAGIDVPRKVHRVEVYVNHSALDPQQVASLAPPWSAVPWQLLALMEEAVLRGWGAFSEQEARRRAVPWLDLVRDRPLLERLRGLIAGFERSRYLPPALSTGALAGRVSREAARARWEALAEFARKHGHLLDTNGAYLLRKSADAKTEFEVVRNFGYAVGIGSYDSLADAPSARVTSVAREGRQVFIEAELETIERAQRERVVTRAPLRRGAARGLRAIQPRARLVVIGPDGQVVSAQQPAWQEDGRFSTALPENLPPGGYTLTAAVYADQNAAGAGVGILKISIPER